jgi:hypothetical protein
MTEIQEINVQLTRKGIYSGGGSSRDDGDSSLTRAILADRNGLWKMQMAREKESYPQAQLL